MHDSLSDLQQDFVDNLIALKTDPVFLSLLEGQGFDIYRNNRRVSLVKTLVSTYFVTARLVGEKYFRAMIDNYLKTTLSYSTTLNDYGFGLAERLVGSPFVIDLPYLIDVMRLEWHLHCISIGRDNSQFDWRVLNSVPSEQHSHLIFSRPDNSVLMHSVFPIDRIWETNQLDFVGDDAVDLGEGAVYLFIGRRGFDLKINRLTPLQWQILSAIDGKRSLKKLHKALSEKVEEQSIIESLPSLIKAGYIAKFC